MKMVTFGMSDPGKSRSRNEDCFAIYSPASPVQYAFVADGMGGHTGGEVASSLCRDAMIQALNTGYIKGLRGPELLKDAISYANTVVWEAAQKDTRYPDMGCTLASAMLDDGEWTLAHVGDSRIYLFRQGRLAQLTRDHSLVQEMVRSGLLSPKAVRRHPQRHMITRAVGVDVTVKPDTLRLIARPGDVLLLCSDGLTDVLSDEDLLILLSLPETLSRRARRLTAVANQRGGPDNITVVLAEIPEVSHG